MPESVDVTKMKVADLKRELKVRGLAVTGNKNELSERLQAALIDGELSLDDTAISGEDLLDEDGVLTDEEEKILNENELLGSPELEKQDLSDLLHEKEINHANNAPGSAKKVVLKRKISTSILNDIGSSTSVAMHDNLLTPSKVPKKVESTLPTNTPAESSVATGVKKIAQLTAQERLEMRAKKFGLNATAENKSTTVSAEIPSAANDGSNLNSDTEAAILKKRAERFGCVVSSKMVQLDVQDRLQKRKERFAGANTKTDAKSIVPEPTNDVWAEKARLRLERFKSSEQKTINA